MGGAGATQRIITVVTALAIGTQITLALTLHLLGEFAHAIHHFSHGFILLLQGFALVVAAQRAFGVAHILASIFQALAAVIALQALAQFAELVFERFLLVAQALTVAAVTFGPTEAAKALQDAFAAGASRCIRFGGPTSIASADVAHVVASWSATADVSAVFCGDYSMDHTAAVYLMDGAGHLHTLIGYGETNEAALAKIKELIGAG